MQRVEYSSNRRERAVKVYTVCDESRYLIVKNVPALGCIDELTKLFALYGDIEEYRLLDEEDCEPFTDVYWIKYYKYGSARFAKKKLDDYKFLGNLLQVTYAPDDETVRDTKFKLEERRRTVLNRIQTNQQTVGSPPQVKYLESHLQDPVLTPSVQSPAQVSPPLPLHNLPWKSGVKNLYVLDNSQVTLARRTRVAEINSDIMIMPRVGSQEASQNKREELGAGHQAKGKRPIEEDNVPVVKKDTRRRI